MPQPFDRDRLHMLPRDRAAVVAHTLLDPIQTLPPHEQLAAVAILFAAITKRFGYHPADAHSYGTKQLSRERFHHKGNAQMDALEAFADMSKNGALT